MPIRQRILLAVVAIGLVAMAVSGSSSPNSSISDVLFASFFSVVFFLIAFLSLRSRGQQSAKGHRGLPRFVWVLFASFAAAFALAMFGAVLSMPWFGYKGFDLLLSNESGWFILPVLAAIAFPVVNRRLR